MDPALLTSQAFWDDATPVIAGDRELVAQAVTNLLENTQRHTPQGTAIEISLADAVVVLAWQLRLRAICGRSQRNHLGILSGRVKCLVGGRQHGER